MFFEELYKITLSFNDDKRLQSFNKVKSYLYGTSVRKAYKKEMLEYIKTKKLNVKDD